MPLTVNSLLTNLPKLLRVAEQIGNVEMSASALVTFLISARMTKASNPLLAAIGKDLLEDGGDEATIRSLLDQIHQILSLIHI